MFRWVSLDMVMAPLDSGAALPLGQNTRHTRCSNVGQMGYGTGVCVLVFRSFGDCGFKSFLRDRLQQLAHFDLPGIIGHTQHIMVPLVFDLFHTLKPYQGFFDPVGSVGSQQVQAFAHAFDEEGDRGGTLRRGRRGHAAAGQKNGRKS